MIKYSFRKEICHFYYLVKKIYIYEFVNNHKKNLLLV